MSTPPPNAKPRGRRVRVIVLVWLVLVLLAWNFDAQAMWFVQGLARRLFDSYVDAITTVGLFATLIAILAAFPNWKRLTIGFAAAMLTSTFFTHLLKGLVGRARPDEAFGTLYFHPFQFDITDGQGGFESFPSGHTSAAVALATLLGWYFPRARWWFWLWASAIALSRMLDNKHYLSDVIAGAGIGYGSVMLCRAWLGVSFFDRDWRPQNKPNDAPP